MGMSGGGSGGGLNSEINVTPMVDIMLVLLIIFMVVTPLLQQGITVALPQSRTPDVDPAIIKESSIVIAIPNDGEYYVDKDRVSKEELNARIEKRMRTKTGDDRIVYIKSGVGVSYGSVVEIINVIRQAGVDQIGLVADKKKGGGAAAPAAPGGAPSTPPAS
jgi:biopolymer transport protein ExbD/biopolymer transport protein TolR